MTSIHTAYCKVIHEIAKLSYSMRTKFLYLNGHFDKVEFCRNPHIQGVVQSFKIFNQACKKYLLEIKRFDLGLRKFFNMKTE